MTTTFLPRPEPATHCANLVESTWFWVEVHHPEGLRYVTPRYDTSEHLQEAMRLPDHVKAGEFAEAFIEGGYLDDEAINVRIACHEWNHNRAERELVLELVADDDAEPNEEDTFYEELRKGHTFTS